MNAGRELDALIAEKVMGWIQLAGNGPLVHPKTDCLYGYDKGDSLHEFVFHYSTQIADAWQVVEKFMPDSVHIDVYHGGCTVKIKTGYFESGSVKFLSGSAPTAPLAICLAALKAVGDG